MAAVDPLGRQR